MNMFEKQAELGRKLFEINMNAVSELIKTQQEGMKTYLESNTEYGKKLPEINDLSSAMELSREYNETIWSNFREATEAQASIVRGAFEEAGEAMRTSFTAEDTSAA